MSTSGLTSSLLSQIAGSSGEANQFVTDLNQLAQDVQTGNLSAAESDYVTLSDDALKGTTSSTATTSASGITTNLLSNIASSSSSSTSLLSELNQLGTDLQNGNTTSAQQDMLALDSTALNAASSTATASTTSATTPSTPAQSAELVSAIVQAMGAGDNSAVSSALAELASIAPSSAGASVLEQESESFGGSALSTSSSISGLLQGLNTSSSTNSTSTLSLLG